MRIFLKNIIIVFCFFCAALHAENLVRDFALYKINEGDKRAPTLLLMGGIHGNEPGAYYATDVFMRHYKITKGSVWVVPVVNPHSMFANVRGLYGDMNRKFAALAPTDPDYKNIQKIKELLHSPEIDISLHLHDGSGYWRPTYISSLLNPLRWGNCSVIDQATLEGAKYGNLKSYVSQMVADINEHILAPIHRYHLHNTHTEAKNDTEQLKALTFYSLSLGKPALTNEASKELDLPTRVYYHLHSIESLLGQLGISFMRDFTLDVDSIKPLVSPKGLEAQINNLITLPLESLRPHITYFPLPKNTSLKHINLQSESHLLGLLSLNQAQTQVALKHGSHTLSTLIPEYRSFDSSLKEIGIKINGERRVVPIGSLIYLDENENIEFESLGDYRVNVIGFVLPNQSSNAPNESNVKIYKKDLLPKYSLDTTAKTFRAEFYRGEAFSGMITFSFDTPKPKAQPTFVAIHYTPATTQKDSVKVSQVIAQNTITRDTKAQSTAKEYLNKPEHKITSKETTQSIATKDNTKEIVSKESLSKNAQDSIYFVKSEKGVNVRTQGNTNAQIIVKLPQGTRVNLIEGGKWSKVSFTYHSTHNKEGYIITSALTQTEPQTTTSKTQEVALSSAKHIKDSKPIDSKNVTSQDAKLTESSNEIKQTPNAKVKVSIALVRNAPSMTGAVVAKAPLGRQMRIVDLSADKKWAKIHYIFHSDNGTREISGYVARHLLSPLENTNER
ncbi:MULTISPECIES: M99 family carboxypeptidase catalytic domain-containing protein [Helicobacter]|nr:M99 family carboxypeptidase catalytic domain-containing protein [Helicobacter sp. MIT 03-1616]TLD86667.1 hypothetical protein LS67_007900 [Helicobacter sp. MIT 03-1616]